jgi:acyl-CoA reductase-like NAD-dependent aldehyde dehydrogenase
VRLVGETIPVADPGKRVITWRQPKGVWAVVTAFNYPVMIPAEYAAPALAAGNAVIVKPAPTVAGVAAIFASCIQDADLPPGLFNVLTGRSADMARHLVAHDGVVGVGFTGSWEVGRQIARAAAEKDTILEMGGNGPIVVLDDADLEAAVRAVAISSFRNSGQICVAAGRVLVSESVHDELVEGVLEDARNQRLGDPRLPETTLGPLNHEGVARRVTEHVRDANERGASVLIGGERATGFPTDLYFPATVITNVEKSARVLLDETFGPVAPFYRGASDEELLAVANAASQGLNSAVFTRDLSRAFHFAERLQTGQVVVNGNSYYGEAHIPFGGWAGKTSGRGRLGVRAAMQAFSQVRTVAFHVGEWD